MKKNIYKTIIVFLLIFGGQEAFSATIYLGDHEIGLNQESRVDLYLDTEGEDINTIDFEIKIPKDLRYIDAFYGDSIISIWIDQFVFENDALKVSGIIPGGFQSQINGETSGKIATLIFNGNKIGKGNLEVNGNVFLNDGLGTEVRTKRGDLSFRITEDYDQKFDDDNIPPEQFEIKIVSDSELYGSKYALIFTTKDYQSGIDYYELFNQREDNWKIIESPYVFDNLKEIKGGKIKAVDKSGNVTIVDIEVDIDDKNLLIIFIFGILIVIIIAIYIVKHAKK